MLRMFGCIQKNVLLPAQQGLVAAMEKFDTNSKKRRPSQRNTDVDPTAARALSAPFAHLNHIAVAELRLDHRHKGSRVEGIVCCKAIRLAGIQILLEDAKNSSHAVRVGVHNLLPASARLTQVRQLLPEGAKIAILEPYCKTLMDGTSGIQVDNPADIVLQTYATQQDRSAADNDFSDNKAQGDEAYRFD